MTILQSAAGFINVVPAASDFLKALTNMIVNFAFATTNMRQPKSAPAVSKSTGA